jgi:hypothetical protein
MDDPIALELELGRLTRRLAEVEEIEARAENAARDAWQRAALLSLRVAFLETGLPYPTTRLEEA